jgi:AraC family transcriptional regulator
MRAVDIRRKKLFENQMLQIGAFEARPTTDACSEVERQSLNAIVLPFSGLFTRHDAPGRQLTGTPSHAIYFAPDAPYRISFPGAIGDRAIILRFDAALAPEQVGRWAGEGPAAQGLLPARAMMLRNLLWTRLEKGETDGFEAEALGLDLLNWSLESVRPGKMPARRSALARRTRALERVKEAVASSPSDKWNVARLANVANLSPFHLCHVFREMTGTSIYDYVLHERLARTLDAVLDCDDDLTSIALDAGFASHSHFTARFRNFFGCTPAALRRLATAAKLAELRKIVTAHANRSA